MIRHLPSRLLLLLVFVLCAASMGFVLYLQYYQYLNPCPLCMFQRVFLLLTGGIALLGALHGRALRWYAALCGIAGLVGFAIAVRHALLQYWPPAQVSECGAGLFSMLDSQPWGQVIATVLRGTGECAIIDWTLLGLSLPVWSALMFAVLVGLAAYSTIFVYSARRRRV